jgi:hypothetical protein
MTLKLITNGGIPPAPRPRSPFSLPWPQDNHFSVKVYTRLELFVEKLVVAQLKVMTPLVEPLPPF